MKLIITAALTAAALVSAPAMANTALAKKSNCLACHSVDKKLLGPAYKDIAAKYKGDAKAEARLFDRVKKGTGATGGEIWKMGSPMPPNSAVKDEDIKTLVKWILAGAPAK
ncbi:MAG: c-type cytochrome [Sterolibacterium sp.]|nr:c-type cytochrome [Sterolibacterium sp.]MBP9800376.1 c-type cytochrome [Sterolibacterium sp.]